MERELVLHQLHYTNGSKENSRHFSSQSEVNPEPFVTHSYFFCGASRQLHVRYTNLPPDHLITAIWNNRIPNGCRIAEKVHYLEFLSVLCENCCNDSFLFICYQISMNAPWQGCASTVGAWTRWVHTAVNVTVTSFLILTAQAALVTDFPCSILIM